MPARADPRAFEEQVLPHLNAAYRLARWLTANKQDAEDVVQEACVRAYRFFGGFRGGDARAWLLRIVRNSSYTWLQRNRKRDPATAFDEGMHSPEGRVLDPSTLLLQEADRQLIRRALEQLPLRFKEVLVLREVEGLSYAEIAAVAGIPKGTVMSSLARARRRLRDSLVDLAPSPARRGRVARELDGPSAPKQAGRVLELGRRHVGHGPVPQAGMAP